MGTADKEIACAERTDDLRRARDQGHHAFGLRVGHLAQATAVAKAGGNIPAPESSLPGCTILNSDSRPTTLDQDCQGLRFPGI
jgi:hypothetical protein